MKVKLALQLLRKEYLLARSRKLGVKNGRRQRFRRSSGDEVDLPGLGHIRCPLGNYSFSEIVLEAAYQAGIV
ncbi:hypothetical protein SAMN06265337_4301 [Hymenobacter gelipurpurascens]|uniref:Uncharacterized protein n=1 Tax=Hymenobacter gelipurpurascens TaxID=89968 RepID=A0A212UHQ6_9BACT|nr:hypothetical protein SAMN06265337_4301 [Hymenobacter gelipurpurascens]